MIYKVTDLNEGSVLWNGRECKGVSRMYDDTRSSQSDDKVITKFPKREGWRVGLATLPQVRGTSHDALIMHGITEKLFEKVH